MHRKNGCHPLDSEIFNSFFSPFFILGVSPSFYSEHVLLMQVIWKKETVNPILLSLSLRDLILVDPSQILWIAKNNKKKEVLGIIQ